MQTYKLSLKRRQTGKAGKRLLGQNDIRGVVYGHDLESVPLVGDYQTVRRVLSQAGTSHIIKLEIDEAEGIDVLVKELDHEPVSNRLCHFDLLALKKGQKISVEVPIELKGEAPAAKFGHVVHQLIDNLEVYTTPDKIPESFVVDISTLSEVGDTIHVSDLNFDAAVEIDGGLLEQPIVKIDEVRELEVEDTTAEEEVSADDIPSEHGEEEAEAGAEDEAKPAEDSADTNPGQPEGKS